MLENLTQLVKQYAGDAVISNPAIPNERNDEAIQDAGNAITGSLQQMISQGNLSQVLGMFTGQQPVTGNNPVVQHATGGFMDSLMKKFGLNQQQASGVAGSLIPNVIGQLVNKTNDPSDNSFNIQDIFNKLSGGKTAGMDLPGMLNKFSNKGLDKDGDGDVDLNDLKAAFSGGSGGVMDTIKGLFN